MLLRAWPEIRRATGARLRLIGTDPLQYRLLHSRLRFDDDGIDVLGIVTNEERDRELATGEAVRLAGARWRELRDGARRVVRQATPVVASNIPGFADVAVPDAAVLVPPATRGARRGGRRRAGG